MADDDKKGHGKRDKTAAAEAAGGRPESDPHSAADEPPIARPPPGRRWLTPTELETLRGRLQKRFH